MSNYPETAGGTVANMRSECDGRIASLEEVLFMTSSIGMSPAVHIHKSGFILVIPITISSLPYVSASSDFPYLKPAKNSYQYFL
ncbi:hypothetical protein AB6A40_004069 [Gnathostoma spinigerum]|uniref:Uncharacterized protein n=1 Tax=Gnathostoma spinigerum TaxID=75299 RepID=A0ABD6EBE3_9BILA